MAIRAEWRSLLGRVSRRKALPMATHAAYAVGSSQMDAAQRRLVRAMAWLRSRNPHVTFVVGALTRQPPHRCLGVAVGGHTLSLPSFGGAQVASTAPRYAPLNLAEQSLVARGKSEPEPAVMLAEQTARVVADEEVIELRLATAFVLARASTMADALKPETVALVSGLPDDVQLSDGIKINTQLWMLRPVLLSSWRSKLLAVRSAATP